MIFAKSCGIRKTWSVMLYGQRNINVISFCQTILMSLVGRRSGPTMLGRLALECQKRSFEAKTALPS